jgi:ATP-binding cassette subfamily B protein/subfamily B ATP-binding cassette protein MsbA
MTRRPNGPPRASRQRYREFAEAYKQGGLAPNEESASHPESPRERPLLSPYVGWLLPQWRAIGLVLALAIAAEGLKMVEPLLMRFIVDRLLLDATRDLSSRLRSLHIMGGLFAGSMVLGQLISAWKEDRQRLLDARAKVSLRRSLIKRLFDLPISRLADMKMGGILSRLTGEVELTSGILQKAVILPALSGLRLLVASAILLTLNWRLALTLLATLPALVAVSVGMARWVRPIHRSIRKDAADIDGRTCEAFGGIRVVRAFHRQAREVLDYIRGQHTMLRKEMFASRLELLLWLSWGLLIGGANVAILWHGGYLQLQGRATLGDIVAFQWYMVLLLFQC